MFRATKAFSSFSVNDMQKAREFYEETLGINVKETPEGIELHLAGGGIPVFIYSSNTNYAAKYTVLNLMVDDVDKTVDELGKKGISMEKYDMPEMKTDVKGIMRNENGGMGPKAMAWFKDPSGNILSVLQDAQVVS